MTDYRRPKHELLGEVEDDPQKWAAWFIATAPLDDLTVHDMERWFRDAIDNSADVRRARAAECGPKGD